MELAEELIVVALECTAEWRRQKAVEYPEDKQNLEAATLLDRLAIEVGALEDSALTSTLLKLYEGASDNEGLRIAERESEYRRLIGFWRFPHNGEEYLKDLIEMCTKA
jgi:hypothetical protein